MMKKLTLLLLLAFTATCCTASDSTTPNGNKFKGWAKKPFEACQERVKAMNGKCDIIFIGDSITQAWGGAGKKTWDKNFADKNALNFGIGGDTTGNILWRLDNMEIKDFTPKVAVIMIGTNNYQKTGDCKPEDIAAGIKAVLDKTHETFPQAQIILMNITHGRRKNAADADEILMAANKLIEPYGEAGHIHLIDIASKMTPKGDSWAELGGDKLHLDAAGYELWAELINPLITKFVSSN